MTTLPADLPRSAIRVLSPAEADLLTTAVADVLDADMEKYRSLDSQAELRHRVARVWPDWVELVGRLTRRLTAPPHALVVRGVPLMVATPALLALSCGLGEVVEPYERSWSRLVREIRPPTDRRGAAERLNERLHTDGTDWPQPNDITCLLCVHVDSNGGGRSRLLSIEAIADLIESGPAAVRRAVVAELPWAVAEELGGGVATAPVLSAGRVKPRPEDHGRGSSRCG